MIKVRQKLIRELANLVCRTWQITKARMKYNWNVEPMSKANTNRCIQHTAHGRVPEMPQSLLFRTPAFTHYECTRTIWK